MTRAAVPRFGDVFIATYLTRDYAIKNQKLLKSSSGMGFRFGGQWFTHFAIGVGFTRNRHTTMAKKFITISRRTVAHGLRVAIPMLCEDRRAPYTGLVGIQLLQRRAARFWDTFLGEWSRGLAHIVERDE